MFKFVKKLFKVFSSVDSRAFVVEFEKKKMGTEISITQLVFLDKEVKGDVGYYEVQSLFRHDGETYLFEDELCHVSLEKLMDSQSIDENHLSLLNKVEQLINEVSNGEGIATITFLFNNDGAITYFNPSEMFTHLLFRANEMKFEQGDKSVVLTRQAFDALPK